MTQHLRKLAALYQALGNDEAAAQEGAMAIRFFEEANLPYEVERTRREVGGAINGSQYPIIFPGVGLLGCSATGPVACYRSARCYAGGAEHW